MAIEYELQRDGYLLVVKYSDPFDLGETSAFIDKIQEEIYVKATHRIHAITDFTGVTRPPKGSFLSGLKIARKAHPMAGYGIIVAKQPLIYATLSTFNRIKTDLLGQKHNPYLLCRTLEEAFREADRLLAAEGVTVPASS